MSEQILTLWQELNESPIMRADTTCWHWYDMLCRDLSHSRCDDSKWLSVSTVSLTFLSGDTLLVNCRNELLLMLLPLLWSSCWWCCSSLLLWLSDIKQAPTAHLSDSFPHLEVTVLPVVLFWGLVTRDRRNTGLLRLVSWLDAPWQILAYVTLLHAVLLDVAFDGGVGSLRLK